MRRVLSLLVLSFTVMVHGASAGEAPWSLVKDEQGVQLYSRAVDGSEFLAVKVIAKIEAPLEAVMLALGDGEGCSEWRKLCQSSTVLEKLPGRERYIYMVLDLPWPVADRDLVIHSRSTLDADNKTYTVTLASASSRYPEADYIRAQSSGSYSVKATSDRQVEFSWVIHTDLGGNLSPAMINKRVVDNTFDDVKRLLSLVELKPGE